MLIYGASGHGKELANLARLVGYTVDSFVDDALIGPFVLSHEEASRRYPDVPVLLGAGYPQVRRKMASKSGCFLKRLIHPRVELADSIKIGEGSVIQAGSVLTVNIQIGEHTHINIGSTVSHDVYIGDFVTLSPGVHLCGNVHIESDVFVGAGVVIMNGTPKDPIVIGRGSTIGAGACVTSSVPAGETWVGVPAAPIRRRNS